MPLPAIPLWVLAAGSIGAGATYGVATANKRNKAYAKFLLPWQNSTLDGSGLRDEEAEALRLLATISQRKPVEGENGRPGSYQGDVGYGDYLNPLVEAHKGQRLIRTLIGQGNIQRVGDEWRIDDYYDFDKKDYTELPGAIERGEYIPALSGVSAQVPWKSEFPVDIRIPMSQEQLREFGEAPKAQLAIGEKEYDYVPYRFSEGQTLEDVLRKEFQSNKLKPEGANLERYVKIVKQRNKGRVSPSRIKATESSREHYDRDYYIPIERKKQEREALSLLNSHLGQIFTNDRRV